MMRMHIGLKICHFLLSPVSITEGPKNKIMRKSGIHSSVPCRDSTLQYFLFYRLSRKNAKIHIFWNPNYNKINVSKQYFSQKIEAQRNIIFYDFFWIPSKTKLVLKYCPFMGQNYGCQIFS